MVEVAVERYGGLDVLFNNAGFTNPPRPVEETTEGDLDRALAVNVKGVFLCSRAAIPALRDGQVRSL
jgi:NAD(P)-dependent dehydrogenase (short-subunit alcohol dehydrogenase family)